MRDLNHDFKNLCQCNRDGSFATQHDRESILTLIANQLDEDGFRHLRATGMRSKHIDTWSNAGMRKRSAPGRSRTG
jgi:hypothetical protein